MSKRRTIVGQAGFTLIEVVITIGILMGLTVAVASMLRAGFEVKSGLAEKAKMIHRLSTAIGKLSDDIQHSFYVSAKDTAKNGIGRTIKTVFKIDKGVGTGGDKISLTTKTHRAIKAGAFESDLTYVVYAVQDSKESPGRLNLYRGEFPYIPSDLHDDPPLRLIARDIKSLIIQAWDGEKWSNDYWDTSRGDTRNRLPRMVKITIEAWLHARVEGDTQDESTDQATDKLQTVIYLSDSWEYPEIKEPVKTIRWSNL